MNYYHYFIVIMLGTVVACSSDNEQQTTETRTDSNVVKTTTSKLKPSTINTSPISTSAGIKVYIDPKTGQFLDAPPEGSTPPESTVIQSNNKFGADKNKAPTYEEKQSTTPGGGTYIKMPPPQ